MSDLIKAGAGVPEVSLEKLGAEIRNLTMAAKRMTLHFAIEIGRRLVDAKARAGHGNWADWLKQETEFSQSTAGRLMKLFEEYGEDQTAIFGVAENSSTLKNLSVSNALALLALPETEREEFAAEVGAETMSARELEQAIREKKEAEAEAEKERDLRAKVHDEYMKLEEKQKEMELEADRLRRELEELRSRPVEVAVERDEEAVEAAHTRGREEAEAEWQGKLEAKQAELEAAEKDKAALTEKLKALKDKAKSAGAEDKAAREELSAEVEGLRKKLAMSGKEMTTFGLRFESWQGAFGPMKAALDGLDEQTREKMLGAVKAQLTAWGKVLEGD